MDTFPTKISEPCLVQLRNPVDLDEFQDGQAEEI